MLFSLITFVVAIIIAIIAAWFSIAGLVAIFSASAVSVAIMAGALEVGKLISASWVYRNWKRAPFLLKGYLTAATVILMFITSMGIFGFLSKAHLEQTAQTAQSGAKIERIERDIERAELDITRLEARIGALRSESTDSTSDIQAQIDAEQARMDAAYGRIQPTIDELNKRIEKELNKGSDDLAVYNSRIKSIDESLSNLQKLISDNDVRGLQSLVGTTPDGRYGPKTAETVDKYRNDLATERESLLASIENIKQSIDQELIAASRVEINELRARTEQSVARSQETIDGLRRQLDSSLSIDNTETISKLESEVNTKRTTIDSYLDEKFELETQVRGLEAEVGPIKYVAEIVYGDAGQNSIDSAVRWLIIIFIFVFDPLAVLLLIAANYSFLHRNDIETRQKEIFEVFTSHKSEPKPEVKVDNDDEKRDNSIDITDEVEYEKVEKELSEQIESVLDVETHKDHESFDGPIETQTFVQSDSMFSPIQVETKKHTLSSEVEPVRSIEDINRDKILKNSWLNNSKQK